MQFGINLLPTKKIGFETKEFWRRIKLFGGVILPFYIVLMIGLLAAWWLISSSENKVRQDLRRMELESKGFEKKESLQLTLKERTETANKILKTRVDQQELLMRIQGFVLPGVSLSAVNLSGDKVSFSGEAQNAKDVGDFLDQFENPSKTDRVWSQIRLTSLSRDTKGFYVFSFEAVPILK